jgi:cellulose synthase/poly-beta-1,6-N-acetylglucosamine synthase-like glycosyltransferase
MINTPTADELAGTRGELPKISVLVAAWREARRLPGFVRSFEQLAYPNKELVLCAGGDDGTYERAVALAGASTKVVRQSAGEGKQAALRRAFPLTDGAILMLTDADVRLSSEALWNLVAPILSGEERATTGTNRPAAEQLADAFVMYQYALLRGGLGRARRKRYLATLLGRNCAVERGLLEAVGAFNEEVATGTDSHLAKKLLAHGARIRFVPSSVVETHYATDMGHYIRQRSRWRRNAILKNLRPGLYGRALVAMAAPAIAVTMLGLPVVGLAGPRPLLYVWAALFVYAYGRRLRYLAALYADQGRAVSPAACYSIPAYLAAEWAGQALAIVQLLGGRLRRSW